MSVRGPRALSGLIAAVASMGLLGVVRADPAPPYDDGPPLYGKICGDESRTVGRSTCRRYGDWALQSDTRVHINVHSEFRRVSGLGSSTPRRDGVALVQVSGGRNTESANVDGFALGFGHRATVGFAQNLYLGLEITIGQIDYDPPPVDGQQQEGEGYYYTGAAVGGAGFYLGNLLLRAELAAGGRVIALASRARDAASSARNRSSFTRLVIEPRASAELWLSPWLTIGARAGTDLVNDQEVMFGLYLGIYSHAFDGSRPRY